VVEATYLYQIAPWWTLQPDLQVVINPGANIPSAVSSRPLKDAVIGGLHVIITF
jgi:porin